MQKTIQINPDFLQIVKKKTGKKERKNKKHSLKAKDIKKQLLKKIKDHQIKSQEALKKEKKVHVEGAANLEDEFRMSMTYLNKVSKEKKQKKERKKREKKQKKHAQTQPIKQFKLKEDPPFGVLKGGKKPLYRDYMKTLKKTDKTNLSEGGSITILDGGIEKNKELNERQKKLKKLRKKVKKRNFTIGKNKKRRVGVLIKNKTLRKKIEEKKKELKKTPINDVKKYLRKHGFIRVGTPAPNDVTRTMYQDANSAGDVYNRSPEVLLYNYLNDK